MSCIYCDTDKYTLGVNYWVITIPEVPASVNHPIDDLITNAKNRRATEQEIKKYKRRWQNKIALVRFDRDDLPSFNEMKVRVKMKFYFDVGRTRDHDNYFIALKGMTDGLFKKDDAQNVEQWPPDFLIDKANPRTEIHIYSLDSQD